MKRAFTLLEIVFVLIILGILAAIGSEIIAKVYENYLLSRSVSSASYKLDVALLQIAQRLSQRVPNTVVVRDGAGNLNTLQVPTSTAYNHIEWIGRAFEARRGQWNGTFFQPGWSGLADLDASDKTKLVTPGSNLSYAKSIIQNVYGMDLDSPSNGCALIFASQFETSPIKAYGYDGSMPNEAYQVYRVNNTTFGFVNTGDKNVSDIYDLACSAYAIQHNNNNQLILYYNYKPWKGETYLNNGQSVVLLDNVTTFQIRSKPVNVKNQLVQGAIEIRICTEDNSTGTPVEFCGQKVVF